MIGRTGWPFSLLYPTHPPPPPQVGSELHNIWTDNGAQINQSNYIPCSSLARFRADKDPLEHTPFDKGRRRRWKGTLLRPLCLHALFYVRQSALIIWPIFPHSYLSPQSAHSVFSLGHHIIINHRNNGWKCSLIVSCVTISPVDNDKSLHIQVCYWSNTQSIYSYFEV